jgi:Fe-S oxidoreductase
VGYSGRKTYCCGFGGIYAYIDSAMASRIAGERRNQLIESNTTIVTFCPVCKRALDAKDVSELIAESI